MEGFTQAFGVFQTHYTSGAGISVAMMPAHEAKNRAAIGAIGSLGGGGIVALFGFFLTPLMANMKSIRLIAFVGTFLFALGLGTEYWHLMLTQGILTGIGSGLLQYPLLNIAPEYFSKRGGKAMGLITACEWLLRAVAGPG